MVSAHRYSGVRKLGSVGQAIPGVEIAILDDADHAVPSGEVGEVCVRGPNVMQGYYRLADETAAAPRHGWLHTGDMGRLDGDGYLYIVERKKDLIIRGGFNIYPRDVEEVLYAHPAVAEAAVVGMRDPLMGEEVLAYVVLKPGATHSTRRRSWPFASHAWRSTNLPDRFAFSTRSPRAQSERF